MRTRQIRFLPRSLRHVAHVLVGAFVLPWLVTCGGSDASLSPYSFRSTDPNRVATVVVSPSAAASVVGQAMQYTAVAKNANGDQLTGKAVVWKSSDPSLATVDTSGKATGVGVGTAAIVAVVDSVSGQGLDNVSGVPIASITVVPHHADLAIG